MIELHLVRHGAVDGDGRVYGARVDPPLSTGGHAEVDALRDRLVGGSGPARLIRSPATRAAQTSEALGLGPAEVDQRWAERDLGEREGCSWSEFWTLAPPEVSTDPASYVAWVPPGGESVASLRERVVEALEQLAVQAPEQPAGEAGDPPASIVVVTHRGPIVCAVAHALDLDDATATRLEIATATVTTLRRYAGGHWTVRAVGR